MPECNCTWCKSGDGKAADHYRLFMAGRVSSQLRQVPDFRREGLAGQRLLSACSANVPSRPTAVVRVDELGVSNGWESGRSPPDWFGAPQPQVSGAGQRSFVWAGHRPYAVVRLDQPDVGSESVLHDFCGADFGKAVVRRDFENVQ
jgi:hypothetical protein